jgi:hypothetical protein
MSFADGIVPSMGRIASGCSIDGASFNAARSVYVFTVAFAGMEVPAIVPARCLVLLYSLPLLLRYVCHLPFL